MWQSFPLPIYPFLPSSLALCRSWALHYKVKPQPWRILWLLRRHEAQVEANYSACDIVATLPRATWANYTRQQAAAKPQLPLTPDYLPCTEIHNVCSFIVRGYFFLFLFCEGLGRRSFKGCGASVANRFDCFVGIVITSITYYCCSDDVLYSMHTWNFHINFGNINGAHTLSQTLACRQAMKVIFHAMCDTRNVAFGFGDEQTICSTSFCLVQELSSVVHVTGWNTAFGLLQNYWLWYCTKLQSKKLRF